MLKNRKQKGFTIVELVIVIAVIAILAAVLIPTFSNIVDKANTSADIHIVKNLNTILASEAATEGKNSTMTEALKDAEENGYTVEKLTPTNANNEILWDSVNDCFALLEKDATEPNYCGVTPATDVEVKDCNYFKIYNAKRTLPLDGNTVKNEVKYSIYLGKGAVEDTVTALTVSKGIDVGNNPNITSITYDRSSITDPEQGQDVVIRTNGGELTIDAANDNVAHFGEVNNVNVIAIKSASYHEHGNVIGTVSVQSGHVQVEAGAAVASIIAEMKAEDNTATAIATVTATNGATVGTVVVNDNTAEIKVESGATVAAVAPGKNVTLDPEKVTGTTPSTTPIDTTQASNFAGGLGTEASPYLIANMEQFIAINNFSNSMSGLLPKAYYFRQIADITLTEDAGSTSIVESFSGVYDGNQHNITITTYESVDPIFRVAAENAKFKDINLHLSNELVYLCDNKTQSADLVFENVDIYGKEGTIYALEENHGVFLGWAGNGIGYNWAGLYGTVTFTDCDVKLDAVTESYSAIFIGGGNYYVTIMLDNCTYSGSFYGKKVAFVLGNSSNYWGQETVTIKNCKNLGSIYGTDRAAFIGGSGELKNEQKNQLILDNNNEGVIARINDPSLGIDVVNNIYRIKQGSANAVSYKIQLTGGTRRSDDGENSTFQFTIDLGEISFVDGYYTTNFFVNGYLATVEQYKEFVDAEETFSGKTKYISESGDEFYIIVKEGKCYYVFDFGGDPDIYFATKQNGEYTSAIVKINTATVFDYNEAGVMLGMSRISDPHTTIEG